MEIHILYRLKFFVAKNHLSSSLTAVFLAVVLLDHVQYVLLISLSTQGLWHYACAYALLFRDKLKVGPTKKIRPDWTGGSYPL